MSASLEVSSFSVSFRVTGLSDLYWGAGLVRSRSGKTSLRGKCWYPWLRWHDLCLLGEPWWSRLLLGVYARLAFLCFIGFHVTSRPHRLMKTSSMQSKRRDIRPKWLHRETNDNTLLLLSFYHDEQQQSFSWLIKFVRTVDTAHVNNAMLRVLYSMNLMACLRALERLKGNVILKITQRLSL